MACPEAHTAPATAGAVLSARRWCLQTLDGAWCANGLLGPLRRHGLWVEGEFELLECVSVVADRVVEAVELVGVLVVDGLECVVLCLCAVFEGGEALLEVVEAVPCGEPFGCLFAS